MTQLGLMEDDNPLGVLAATAALEVQILVVRHTCYNCTGLPKDFGLWTLWSTM